jgi:hypothetical protein
MIHCEPTTILVDFQGPLAGLRSGPGTTPANQNSAPHRWHHHRQPGDSMDLGKKPMKGR